MEATHCLKTLVRLNATMSLTVMPLNPIHDLEVINLVSKFQFAVESLQVPHTRTGG